MWLKDIRSHLENEQMHPFLMYHSPTEKCEYYVIYEKDCSVSQQHETIYDIYLLSAIDTTLSGL